MPRRDGTVSGSRGRRSRRHGRNMHSGRKGKQVKPKEAARRRRLNDPYSQRSM